MFKKILFFIFFLFVQTISRGQTTGDYRSAGSGNWTALLSWQYFNGTTWATPTGTSPQGYPGQYAGTGTVTISNGNAVTLNVSPANSITKLLIGDGTSATALVYADFSIGGDFTLITSDIVIDKYAILKFTDNKGTLYLQQNTGILINAPGGLAISGGPGNCNNNVNIYLGLIQFGVCTGGGAVFTFQELNNGGGTLYSKPTSPSPICQSETIFFTGNASNPNPSSTVSYSWSIVTPSGSTVTSNVQNPTITNSLSGNYLATLTCSATYSGISYSNSETITVKVNAAKTVTAASSSPNVCQNTAIPNVTHTTTGATGIGAAIGLPTGVTASWASNTITISGTPSVGGVYNYSIPLTGGCGSVNALGTITVKAIPTITLGANPVVCINTGIAYLPYTAIGNVTNGSGGYSVNYDAAANAANFQDFSNYAITTSPLPLIIPNGGWGVSPGTYNGLLTINDNTTTCVSVSYPISITIVSSTAPTVGTIMNPTCDLATGSVVLSGLTVGANLVQTGTSSATIAIVATTQTVSGLAAGGTYYYSVSNGTCTSSVSEAVTIGSIVTNTYTGSWSNGTPPAIGGTQNLVFDADYFAIANLSGCSCTVNLGKDVVISQGKTLSVTNGVSVFGSLTFEEDTSLVQDNATATNIGNIIYKRTSTSVLETDYTYWSSPVIDQTLYDASPYTPSDYFYGFDSASDDWAPLDSSQIMEAGIGYTIRRQIPIGVPPPGFFGSNFIGSPNNGTITISGIANDRSYLLGNPYPSAIDADDFLITNSEVLDGTIYFWTHNTPIGLNNPNPGSGLYAYSADDYALYNLTGGTVIDGITYDQGGTSAPSGGEPPSGKIAACQGFFASSKIAPTGSTIVFDNSMRLVENNTQFFKQNSSIKSKTTTTLEKNRIWLNLSNTEGLFKQVLVGYISGATNGYDGLYDGESFDANPYADFYSINGNKNLTIQGRSLPFDDTDEVPLGYRSDIEGQFTINIDQTDGVLVNQEVYIEDKVTNTIHDLKQIPYMFTSVAGTFDDRFVLRFTDKNLGKDDFKPTENAVVITKDKKEVKIKSGDNIIQKIVVYDLLGRKIYDKEAVGKNEFLISNLALSNQVGVIKVTLDNGKIVTKKLLF
jgi:hypothetical protein